MRSSPARRPPAAFAGARVVAVALGLAVLAGCGQEEGRPIPASAAQDIVGRLDEVQRRADARACNDIRQDSLPALRREVDGLPDNVDENARTTLSDGLDRLSELVATQCRRAPRRRRTTPPVVIPSQPETPTQTQPQQEAPQVEPETPSIPDTGTDGGNGGTGGTDGGNGTGGNDGGGNGGTGGTGGGNGTDNQGSVPPGGGNPGMGNGPGGGVVAPPGAGAGST